MQKKTQDILVVLVLLSMFVGVFLALAIENEEARGATPSCHRIYREIVRIEHRHHKRKHVRVRVSKVVCSTIAPKPVEPVIEPPRIEEPALEVQEPELATEAPTATEEREGEEFLEKQEPPNKQGDPPCAD